MSNSVSVSEVFFLLPSFFPCICIFSFLLCICVHTDTELSLKTIPRKPHPSMEFRFLRSFTHFHLGLDVNPCFGWRVLLLQQANLIEELMASHTLNEG